jgi:hypothetical protein
MYRKGKDIRKKTSVFDEKFPTSEFGMISAEISHWDIERK